MMPAPRFAAPIFAFCGTDDHERRFLHESKT
jgi:hypothetical protein